MRFDAFTAGGSSSARAGALSRARMMNLFSEKVEDAGAANKTPYYLLSKPGLALFCALPTLPVQAEVARNGRAFAIAGNTFYEVKADGSYTSYGAVGSGARAQLVATDTQVVALDGSGAGWVFDLTAATLAPITAAGWTNDIVKLGEMDGYVIGLRRASRQFIMSALGDATQWDTLDIGTAEGEAGEVVSFVVDHRQIWFLSNTHGEVYYNSGAASFPLQRLEGAFFEMGCAAIDSAVRCDNSIFWLGANADGAGVVWRANGYTPARVSTHAVEVALAAAGDLSGVTAYTYQEGGHTFYRLDLATGTWLYDVATGFWHERGVWNGLTGTYAPDLARTHVYCFGKHLVGDYQSGKVYEQSQSYYTDAGTRIRRERTAPDLSAGGAWVSYAELRFLVEAGVGGTDGSDPQVTLQSSDDGGRTWGSERSASLGKLGDYKRLVRFRRLGRSQNRAFRLVCDEPIFVAIISAEINP